jgi:peptidoglycan/LPS O-acetylase OafA/YrhL
VISRSPPGGGEAAVGYSHRLSDRSGARDRKESFYTLDAIRGVAAVAVVMFHAAAIFHPIWMRSAYLAVDLFFILSGFVLAHAYGGRLENGLTASAFFRIRLIRILPLYLLGTTIAIVTALAQDAVGRSEWHAAALVRSIIAATVLMPLPPDSGAPNGYAYPLNIPAWSLFFELLANACYAGAFRVLTPRRLQALVAVALVGLIVVAWHFDGLQAGSNWATLWGGIPRVTFSFFAGVVLYRLAGVVRRPRVISPWFFLAALLVLFEMRVPETLRWVFDLACVVAVFPFVIWHCATARPVGPRQRAVFSLLGQTSYALYALHVPILGVWVSLLAVAGHSPRWFAPYDGVLFLVVVIGCSLAADFYFDAPVRRLMMPAPIRVLLRT